MSGSQDEVVSRVKEEEGKLTDDAAREAQGKAERAKGEAERAASDVKDAIEHAFNDGERGEAS